MENLHVTGSLVRIPIVHMRCLYSSSALCKLTPSIYTSHRAATYDAGQHKAQPTGLLEAAHHDTTIPCRKKQAENDLKMAK